MPKLKLTPDRERSEIIARWKRHWDIPDEKAAACLGISPRTLARRLSNGDWSIQELHRALFAFHIPPEDALQLLTIGCPSLEKRIEAARKKAEKEKECAIYV